MAGLAIVSVAFSSTACGETTAQEKALQPPVASESIGSPELQLRLPASLVTDRLPDMTARISGDFVDLLAEPRSGQQLVGYRAADGSLCYASVGRFTTSSCGDEPTSADAGILIEGSTTDGVGLVWGWAPPGTAIITLARADEAVSIRTWQGGRAYLDRRYFLGEWDLNAGPATIQAKDRNGQVLGKRQAGALNEVSIPDSLPG